MENELQEYFELLNQKCLDIDKKITMLQNNYNKCQNMIHSFHTSDEVGGLFQVTGSVHEYQINLEQKYLQEQKECMIEIQKLKEQRDEYQKELRLLSKIKADRNVKDPDQYMLAKNCLEHAYHQQEIQLMNEYLYSVKQMQHFLLQDCYRADLMLNKLAESIENRVNQLSIWNDIKNKIRTVDTYSEFLACVDMLYQEISNGEFYLTLHIINANNKMQNTHISNKGLYFIYDLLSTVYFFPDVINGCGTLLIDHDIIRVDAKWKTESEHYWIVDAVISYFCSKGNYSELLIE